MGKDRKKGGGRKQGKKENTKGKNVKSEKQKFRKGIK